MALLTPEIGLLFWMVLCFVIVLFILGKFAWPVITGMIEERGEYIENSLLAAKEANEKLQNIKAESEKILAEAKNEQLNILREATKMKEQIIAEAKTKAEDEAAIIIDGAKANIQQEKENAIKDIRAQVAELSVEVAEKVLRKNLSSDESQLEMINKMLDEINIAKS